MTGWEERAADALAFLRRRVDGDYTIDDFGFDPDFSDHVIAPIERTLYDHWFDISTEGLGHVPSEGGALLVANHSGTLPVDALMTQVALHDHHPARRRLRLLAADLVYRIPVVAHLSRKAGNTLACPEDADRLLRGGELVGVFPEGFEGVGKPFAERYRLQRFGRGGFVTTAIRAGVPIVPCAIVGAEEIYPKIGDLRALAKLLGFPYFPITPTFPWLGPLGVIPLPSKWIIGFAEPVRTDAIDPRDADDPQVVENVTEDVRRMIQAYVDDLREKRGPAF
ncbi:MAG TPA: lysophospholipid acyltransferase family protein [Streptosporangiaceae bacterium]